MPTLIAQFKDLPQLVGYDLGVTKYIEVTQERIDLFARATDDNQWIHTDRDRAKDGPFGATIAHGFLTLSLIVPFWGELFDVEGVIAKVNYGLDRVRFTSPVPVGSRLRMGALIEGIDEVKGGTQLTVACTIEIEGSERPAAIATFIARFYS
jgi:acyl dehydratase